MEAYPEKRRLIFVHIPKCAGSDLTTVLRRRYPTLRQGDFGAEGVTAAARFDALHDFAIGVRYADHIAVSGHEKLIYYRNQQLVRPRDRIFAIVRDPVALVYSQVCYILTTCKYAHATRRPDGLAWLRLLGLERIPEDVDAEYMAALGRRVLHDSRLVHGVVLCAFLGEGTARSAVRHIRASNIELTDLRRYDAWREANFPGAAATRENSSERFFTPEMASDHDRAYIAEITLQDCALFSRIAAALERGGGLSVRGRDVAGA